jgi:hypothetical protein
MPRRNALALLVIAVACGCGRDAPVPTMPSATNASGPVAAPAQSRHLSGLVVDAANLPVPGALLTLAGAGGQVKTITDAIGRFEVSLEVFVGGVSAVAEKEGYERSLVWISDRQDMSQTIRLHRPLYVAAGDSVAVVIRANDPSCGFDLEYHCRRIRLTTSGAGTVVASVTTNGSPAGVVLSSELLPKLATAPLTITVQRESEVLLDVLVVWTTPDDVPVMLATTFAPL